MLADIEEQYDKLYRYCYFKLHNAHLAEDITQEAFLRLFESSRLKDIDKPLAFLYTVARNLCIDEFRRKKPESFSSVFPQNMPADSDENQMLDSVLVQMALDELTDREREMVLLKVVNEVPVEDIGKIFGISRFAVYREVKKILKKLERRLSYE
ncbi:MAG TPA: RNA polymerase subunit sigma-24 [Lachnospiraceae bacterium]|nr:RNA polymerase subunit sigma-24 [Lachnospiraceae bacterium]